MLVTLALRPDARQRDLAFELGLSERFTAQVVGELVRDGYLIRQRVGRRNRYEVDLERPLPGGGTPVTVADLLRAVPQDPAPTQG